MKILCPRCGETIKVGGLGRKPLNIPLNIVCETLQSRHDVQVAAVALGCSQGYIFNLLKANNLKLKDVLAK